MYRRTSLLAWLLALASLTPAYAELPWDPFVFIDRPAVDETLSGAIPISGWATGTAGIVSLTVQIDGRNISSYYGTYRADVCQHVNPSDPGCPYVGWESFLDTTQYANGVHTIAVWTYDWAGRWGSSSYEFRIENATVDTVAPSITLTGPAHGSKVRSKVALTASASDAGGVAYVRFFVDGVVLADDSSAPYAVTWSTTGVADGSHAIRAQAFDHAGNTAFSAQHTVTVDNSGPSVAVTAPAAGAFVRGVQTVSASAFDSSGVQAVELWASDSPLGQDTTSPYAVAWDTRIHADGKQGIAAIAKDSLGNSAVSTAVTVTVDNTPPSVTLTGPAHGAAVRGNVVLTATAADNLGVANVRFLVDGASVAVDSTAPYAFTWSSAGVADGSHTIRAQAFDKAGNAVYSAQHTATVDNTPPSVTLTGPAQGAKVRGKVSLTATASDTAGVANVRFFVDGVNVATDSSSPYAFTWSSSGVADGSHVIRAQAFDHAGNSALSAQRTVTVDNTPPSVTVTAPAAGAYVRGVQNVSASASDPSGVVSVEFWSFENPLGQDATSPYTASWDTTVHPDGQRSVQAIAIDSFGGSSVSAAVSVTVDNTPPSVTLTGPAHGAAVRGNVVLTATAADNLGVANVRFLVDGASVTVDSTAPYAFTWSSAGVADGSHVIRAQAFDRAGNAVYSAEHTVTVDNASPAVTLTAPSAGSFLRGVQTVSASATDAGGVKSVQFWASDSPLGDDTTSPYGASWDTTAFADGQYGLVAIAQDHSGNSSVSTAAYVTVDNTPPAISLTSPAQGATVSGDVALAATASDNLGVADVRFFVDGVRVTIDSSSPYAFTWSSTGVADGNHVVRARVFDRAGNATYSAQHTVTVENVDFALGFVPEEGMELDTRGVEPGGTATLRVLLTRADGSSDPVSLSVVGLPSTVTANAPSTVNPGQAATVQLTASANAADGAYAFQIQAAGGSETVTLPGTLVVANLPNVSSVMPDRVSAGAVETVTIHGTDFEGASVWVATEKPNPEAPDRIFPLVNVLSVSPDGTSVTVRIDATTPGVEGFYNLVVENGAGGAAAPIEVLPDRPVIYVYSPAQPSESDIFVFTAVGANLAGASVVSNDPAHVRIHGMDNGSDSGLIGLIEILPGAAPGLELVVANPAGQTALPLQVTSSPEGTRRVASSSTTGSDLLMQQFAPFHREGDPFGGHGPSPGFDPIFSIPCGGLFHSSQRIFYSYKLSDLLGREGREVLDVLKSLPLGSSYDFDLQMIESIWALEKSIRFRCTVSFEGGVQFTDVSFCFTAYQRAEIIGVGAEECWAQSCNGGFERSCRADLARGTIESFLLGNTTSCTLPTDITPPGETSQELHGDRQIEVEQAACCADTLSLHMTGSGSTGLLFDKTLSPIETDVDEATCQAPVVDDTEYMVISWINEEPVEVLRQQLHPEASFLLKVMLNGHPVSCLEAMGLIAAGKKSLIVHDDIDRQYVNAFTFARGGDPRPPEEFQEVGALESFVASKDYRQLSRLHVQHDGQTVSILDSVAGGGRTRDPCTGFRLPAVFPFAVEAFAQNGASGVRSGHAYVLNSFRVGWDGKIVDHHLNGTCPECPVGQTTPWIWSVIRVDRNGELRSGRSGSPLLDTQIFNTFSVYRRSDTAWIRQFDIPQSHIEAFIALDETSQRTEAQIP